eukprot:2665787-Amphidinium_carterae.1
MGGACCLSDTRNGGQVLKDKQRFWSTQEPAHGCVAKSCNDSVLSRARQGHVFGQYPSCKRLMPGAVEVDAFPYDQLHGDSSKSKAAGVAHYILHLMSKDAESLGPYTATFALFRLHFGVWYKLSITGC